MKTAIILLLFLPFSTALSSIASNANKNRITTGDLSMTDTTLRFYQDGIARDRDFVSPAQKKKVATFVQQQQTQQLPSSWDLPRHSPDQQTISRLRLLEDTEMMLGRVAMIAALVLFSVELTTGQSLPYQIGSFFGLL